MSGKLLQDHYGLIRIRLQGFIDSMIVILIGLSIIYLIYDCLKKFFNSEPVIILDINGIENKEYGFIPWSEIEYIKCSPRFLIIKIKSNANAITFQIIMDLNISRQKLKKEILKYFTKDKLQM